MNAAALLMALAAAVAGPVEFREANEAFLHGRYDHAIEGYQALIRAGTWNPDVHYNLGNAYLASGRRGMAVLHYERALTLNPDDDDARSNLEFARRHLQDEAAFMPSMKTPVEDFFRGLPFSPLLFMAMVSWALAFTLLLVRRLFMAGVARRIVTAILIPVASVAALTAVLSAGGVWVREYRPRCVVLSDAAELKEGPSDSFKSVVTLREGVTAGLRAKESGWVRITLPSGVTGWVKTDAIEKI
ncbi:MAG: tetratricopeptide repeat protein [Deltaproteobacteria bacterium]|nr:tetratricopeptide repeat protein [Deltaproteobacteria bacterium]